MRIPKVGDSVLYVAQAADEKDNRPAIVRPAVITNIWSYSASAAEVDLCVTLNGPGDEAMFQRRNTPSMCATHAWMERIPFSEKRAENTFFMREPNELNRRFFPDTQIETIIVKLPITHGRERIKAEAVGIWDQEMDTLTFRREDVENLANESLPVYPAAKFMDLHVARITVPKDYMIHILSADDLTADGDGEESPNERQAAIKDLLQQYHDSSYRSERRDGEPPEYMPRTFNNAMREKRLRRLVGEGRQRQLPEAQDRRPLELTDENGGEPADRHAGEQRERRMQSAK